MLLAVTCFAAVNALAKSMHRLPVHELVFFRSVVSLAFCLWYVRRFKLNPLGNNRKWLVLRGVFGLIALLLFFGTLKHMPLATATVIQYLSPLFTIYIAGKWNNQHIRPIQWLYFSMAFAGVLLIKGWDARVPLLWLMAGIGSSIFAGLAYNAIIRAKGSDHPIVIVLYFPLVALPVTGVWCVFDWVTPQGMEWIGLLFMGALTQVAQYSTTMALHSDDASRVTPWNYFGAIIAVLIGMIWFNELPMLLSLAGMGLVVLGVVLNARLGRLSEKLG